jgi:hypothetical protein
MSLVNDALKRAQLAQRTEPYTPDPDWVLPPVEPSSAQTARRLPWFTAIGALMLACFCVWQMLRRDSADTQPPALTIPPPVPLAPKATLSAPPVALSAPAQPAVRPASQQPLNGATAAATTPIPAPPSPPGQTTVAGPSGPATAPPTLRLQAILLDPLHPSAIINGRTLFLGDKFGEQSLTALDRRSATLVGPGSTNILSLR